MIYKFHPFFYCCGGFCKSFEILLQFSHSQPILKHSYGKKFCISKYASLLKSKESAQGKNFLYLKINPLLYEMWERQLSRYRDWLRAGWSSDRIPVGGEIFRTCPDRPWGPTSLLYNGYRDFPEGKERPGRDADPSPLSGAVVMKGQSYTSTPPMGRTACTEPQCLYRGALYLCFMKQTFMDITMH